jgi:hypothetical protein
MAAPAPVARKQSVTIAEPDKRKAASGAGTAGAAAPAAAAAASSSSRRSPAELSAALLASIPEAERKLSAGWKVKQVVVTRLDSDGAGSAPAARAGVSVPPMLARLKKQGTSKTHKFQPSVDIQQAITWLGEYGNCDSTLLFDNNCAFLFERGTFLEFEDVRSDEDD